MRAANSVLVLDRIGAPFLFVEERDMFIPPGADPHRFQNGLPKLIFVLEGDVWHHFDRAPRVPCHAGTVLVNLRDSYQTYSGEKSRATRMSALRVTFDPALLRRARGRAADADDILYFIATRLPAMTAFADKGNRGRIALIHQIREALHEQGPDSRHRVNTLVRLVVLDCIRGLGEGGARPSHGEQDRASLLAEQVDACLEDHLAEPLTLARIASRLDRSEEHLARIYRQQRGHTIGGELRRRRVEKAKYFLLCTDLPVGRIAERTGFATLAIFSRVFSRIAGQPPTKFRHQAGKI